MRKPAILAALLALPFLLSGCHNDPFSVKPEVPGVRIPERPAPAPEAAEDAEIQPASETRPESF